MRIVRTLPSPHRPFCGLSRFGYKSAPMFQLLFAAITLFTAAPPAATGSLRLDVSGVENQAGMIWVGLYDSEEHLFVQEKAIVQGYRVYQTGRLTFDLGNVPYGRYAVAIFHDVNNNGTLDQNWIGIPQEPYAFADVPGSKWRKPRFEEIDFEFGRDGQVLRMELAEW